MRYHLDSYARTLDTAVLACTPVDGGFEVLLADTVLYPEGGGQPCDFGTIDGHRAVPVRRTFEGVVHRVDAPVAGRVSVGLDWGRRFDHMQQHSGQHLLSALADRHLRLPTIAFHLGVERSDIELDGVLDAAGMAELEERANTAIRDDHTVTVREVDPDALDASVRSRGLPEGFAGRVRLVEIAGIDLNTCGGTHVARTHELQVIKLLGVERLKRGSRVYFAVGGRVRTLLGGALAREAGLTRVLTCAPEQHLASVERALEDAKATSKALRVVQRELATAIGAGLPTQGVVRFHRDDADPAFLSAVADAVRARGDAPGLYTGGSQSGDGVFLVAGPEAWVTVWGPRVATALDGRGGGAKGRFQGKCARVQGREGIVF